MSRIKTIIDAIAEDDIATADVALQNAIREKVNVLLDIKKIAITSDIYKKEA